MAYAVLADLEAAFGAKEVLLLSDRNRDQIADADVVSRAIEDAEAEINSYLSARYVVPLGPVPAQVRTLTCDIARYRLDAANPRQATKDRYDAAVRTLRDLAAGKASLGGATPAGGGAMPEGPAPASQFVVEGGARLFGDENLAGF
jgi:phage gp36-like protein